LGKNPTEESEEDVLDKTSKSIEQSMARRQKRAEVAAGIAEAETYAAKLEEEAREVRRRIASGEPPPPRQEAPTSREYLFAQAMALMQSGVDPAIIGQVLAGQSANGAIRSPQISVGSGVPDWMGKIVADAISSKDEVKIAKVEAQMGKLEDKVTEALKATQEAIKNIGKEPRHEIDPMTYASRQAEGVKTFYEVLKGFGLIPESTTPQIPDAQLAFQLQDREWSHRERMGFLQTEQEKIAANERIEAQKARQRQEALSRFPQIIGETAAKALEDGMVARREHGEGQAPARREHGEGQAPARRGRRPVINMDEGEEMATVTCECGAPITVVAGSKTATCGSCGVKYPVRVTPASEESGEDS